MPISVKIQEISALIFYLGTPIGQTNTNNHINMKKGIVLLAALCMMSAASYAQKFCYVDMEYILGKIPQYADAQKELDKVSAGFQKDIETKRKAVDDMFKQYQSEQVLMTDQMKQQKMKDIESAEKEVKDLQKKKFGPDGELFQKRKELIKPIQDKVYDEITKYAQAKSYDFILDKSSGPSMLYANEKFNKSDDILFNMGVQKK
jgi:outer membrane protein